MLIKTQLFRKISNIMQTHRFSMISEHSLHDRRFMSQAGEHDISRDVIVEKWLPINYPFIFVLISLTSIVSKRKIQKNFSQSLSPFM